MSGEASATLAELAEISVGFAFRSSEFSTDPTDIRLLRGNNIGQGVVRWEKAARWPQARPVPEQYELKVGDVILAMDRPWIAAGLKFAQLREEDVPSYLVQRVARLRALPGNDLRFLSYVVGSSSFSDYVLSVQTGSAVPHISAKQIGDFVVQRRPLSEQQAIAEVLGALDDKIAANTRLAATAEALAKALLGSPRASVPLGDVVTLGKQTVQPASLGVKFVDHYSLPAFDAGQRPERVAPAEIKSGKFLVERPAVLVSKLNPRIPRIWRANLSSDVPSLASTEFLVLEPTSCHPAILWALVSQPAFSAALERLVAGTSGSHQRVRPSEVLKVAVADPRNLPDAQQGLVIGLMTRAQSARDENVALAATRDALLPALMVGKLHVRDAENMAGEFT